MTIPQSVAEILREPVTLEVEGIDRMYLNVYVPRLQIVEGVLGFIRRHRGYPVASTRMVEPITRRFVAALEKFVREHGIPLVAFEKGQRKEDVAAAHRADFWAAEGVVFVGQAQSLCHALLAFPQLPGGFSNRHLRERFAALLGKPATALTPGQMTYHLRRLRLHHIIEPIPGTHRYRLTDFGLRIALFFTRIYNRLLRPGLGTIVPQFSQLSCPLRRAFDKLDREVTTWVQQAQLSAA